MKSMMPNRPRAFRVTEAEPTPAASVEAARPPRTVTIAPDTSLDVLLEGTASSDEVSPALRPRRRRLWSLGRLFVSALGGLVVLAIANAIERYVAALFEENGWLGGVALALAVIAGLALAGLVLREAAAIWRQRRIGALRREAARLRVGGDVAGAARLVADLAGIYARRPEAARARALLAGLAQDVIDPADRLGIAERELIGPLDGEARRLVAASARRVSIVTALAPRAVFDVIFVAGQSLWLIRRVSELYGSRPGVIEFLAITRRVLAHLAVTGGMAIGDSLAQQFLGHGIASRLSAKLGEGVLNGLLTARIGLAAIEACRPLPFVAVTAPRLVDVAGTLLRGAGQGTKTGDPAPG